jgi:hypothetical protein
MVNLTVHKLKDQPILVLASGKYFVNLNFTLVLQFGYYY